MCPHTSLSYSGLGLGGPRGGFFLILVLVLVSQRPIGTGINVSRREKKKVVHLFIELDYGRETKGHNAGKYVGVRRQETPRK